MALATFYRTSRKLIHWGSVFHFGIRINIFKLIYVWKVLCYNMCCTNVTSFSQKSGLGEVVSLSGYATLSHPLRCSEQRWVCSPALRIINLHTASCTSTFVGALSLIGKGEMWIVSGRPGRDGPSFW